MTMDVVFDPQTQSRKREGQRRGFTLTEIAIVLGIIGLILGAVWAAASAVYSNMRTSQAEQGITATAQAVRSMFAASNNTGQSSAALITTPGMFPVSWNSTTAGVVGNPWNQNPAGNLSYVVGLNAQFAIELDNISDAGCAALLSYFNANASTLTGGQIAGLVGTASVVKAGGQTAGTPGLGTTKAIVTTYASPTTCIGGSGNNDSVSVTFDMTKM